jgi:hypothetical protein
MTAFFEYLQCHFVVQLKQKKKERKSVLKQLMISANPLNIIARLVAVYFCRFFLFALSVQEVWEVQRARIIKSEVVGMVEWKTTSETSL